MRWWFVEHHGTPHRDDTDTAILSAEGPLKKKIAYLGLNTRTNNSFQLHSALYVVGTIFHDVLHDLKQKNQLSEPNPRMNCYKQLQYIAQISCQKESQWTVCYPEMLVMLQNTQESYISDTAYDLE